MRLIWIAWLALLAGCATTQGSAETVKLRYSGDGLDYSVARPIDYRPDGTTADLTLVELDAAFAEDLLYIDGHTDIAPRAFRNAMGEIAAVNATYGHGALLARATIRLNDKGPTQWEWGVEQPYLQDWSGKENFTPTFNSIWNGVECELGIEQTKGGLTCVAKTTSSQLALPVAEFTTCTATGTEVKIQIPELSVVERVATEFLQPGETAMFQLSRAPYEDGERIRLLFVRVVTLDE